MHLWDLRESAAECLPLLDKPSQDALLQGCSTCLSREQKSDFLPSFLPLVMSSSVTLAHLNKSGLLWKMRDVYNHCIAILFLLSPRPLLKSKIKGKSHRVLIKFSTLTSHFFKGSVRHHEVSGSSWKPWHSVWGMCKLAN